MYVGADIGGIYDWDLETVPQLQLDGGARPMPQGKVLGGGSILNAMCWNRGGQDDYNAWEGLGNPGWGWDGMLPYFMKVRTDHKPSRTPIDNTLSERNLYTGVFRRDCRRVLNPLQSCCSWLFWSRPGQLSEVFLSTIRQVECFELMTAPLTLWR